MERCGDGCCELRYCSDFGVWRNTGDTVIFLLLKILVPRLVSVAVVEMCGVCGSVVRLWEADLEHTLVSGASRSSSALSIVAAVSEIVLWVRVDGA